MITINKSVFEFELVSNLENVIVNACSSLKKNVTYVIHGFTISVPLLILPIFWQLLLGNGKMLNLCFESSTRANTAC